MPEQWLAARFLRRPPEDFTLQATPASVEIPLDQPATVLVVLHNTGTAIFDHLKVSTFSNPALQVEIAQSAPPRLLAWRELRESKIAPFAPCAPWEQSALWFLLFCSPRTLSHRLLQTFAKLILSHSENRAEIQKLEVPDASPLHLDLLKLLCGAVHACFSQPCAGILQRPSPRYANFLKRRT